MNWTQNKREISVRTTPSPYCYKVLKINLRWKTPFSISISSESLNCTNTIRGSVHMAWAYVLEWSGCKMENSAVVTGWKRFLSLLRLRWLHCLILHICCWPKWIQNQLVWSVGVRQSCFSYGYKMLLINHHSIFHNF